MFTKKCGTAQYCCDRSPFFALLPALVFILLLYTGCSRSARDIYRFSNSHKGQSTQLTLSKDLIDSGRTYELYFRLEKEVRCIEVNLVCSVLKNQFTGERMMISSCYLVERVIDIRSFSKIKADYMFSEIGRNYDENWNCNRTTRICSSRKDPIRTFSPDSLYRIRLTSFNSADFDYRLMVKADTRIKFFYSMQR